ncbi:MAG: hypothetical protein ACR2GD_04480 [Pyrinomonadaceae bacterium]
MSQNFQAGDDLIFQIESGYGLIRILAIDDAGNGDKIWHLSAFNELFLDVETAEAALANSSNLTLAAPHFAVTQRAFDSTQVARLDNRPLSEDEIQRVAKWRENPDAEISDRSVRLMLGLR